MRFGIIASGFKKQMEKISEDPKELLFDALWCGFQGAYEEALEYLDKGIYLFTGKFDDWENKANFWLFKSKALYELQKYEEALFSIDKAIEIAKDEADLYIMKVDILHEMERYEDALEVINTGKKHSEKELHDKFLPSEAHMLSHFKKHQEALELYNKFLEKHPDDPDSLYGKSEELFELGKTKESLEAVEEGLKHSPEDGDLIFQKGFVLSEMKKLEEALSCYEQAIDFDSSDQDTWFNKAGVLSLLNQKEEALDALTVAVGLDSENIIDMQKDSDFDNIRNTERFKRLASQEI